MRNLSEITDPGTVMRKILVNDGLHRKRASGWMACVIGGVLKEFFMYLDIEGYFVSDRGVHYRIDKPCKPISGAFDVKSLYGTD